MSPRQRQWIYLILAFGLVLRLILPTLLGGDPYRGDGADYLRYATNLFEHGIYTGQFENLVPQAGRMPGVPILIWIGLHFFTADHWAMLLPNILLGWGVLLVMHLFLHDLKVRPRLHLLALAIYAAFPAIDYYAAQFYPEVPAAFLMFFSLWSFSRYLHSASGKWVLVAAIALGLSLYFRPELILPLPLYLGAILLSKTSLRQKIIHAFVFTSVVVLILAPWTLRNYKTQNAFMPFGNNFLIENQYKTADNCSRGKYLWLNTWHYKESQVKTGAWYFSTDTQNELPQIAFDSKEEEQIIREIRSHQPYSCLDDQILLDLAQQKAAAYPLRQHLILPLKRCFFLLFRVERSDSLGETWLLSLAWLGLALFGGLVNLLGLTLPFVKNKPKGIVLLLWLLILERLLFFAWIYHVESRYMLILFPVFFILAVHGINRLFQAKPETK